MRACTIREMKEIIERHRKSAQLSARLVGSAPTYEWTGLATDGLKQDLTALDYGFHFFYSDVRGQPLYGKKCVAFTVFGSIKN